MITAALALATLAGFSGLALDVSSWEVSKRDMQGAADLAAYSAAVAAGAGDSGVLNAKAVTVGFVDSQSGVTVTVNNPPTSGASNTNSKAWEVIIRKPQLLHFARLFMSSPPAATSRSVAILGVPGSYCVLALDPNASGAISLQGSPQINASNCNIMADSSSASAVTLGGSARISANTLATVGNPGYVISGSGSIGATLDPGAQAIGDPYASVSVPASSTWGPCQPAPPSVGNNQTATMTAGCYTGNITVGNGGTLNLGSGTYYIDRGSISSNGGTINGTGVTLVLTSRTGANYSTISLNGSSTINLTAQTSGTFSGLVVYADRRMPNSTGMSLGGGSGQSFTGDRYFPSTAVTFGGNSGASTCSRLIALTITLSGSSTFEDNCTGMGTALIASPTQTAE